MDLPFVATLVRREVVGSTSDLARELLEAGEPALPLVVWALRQTRGRGRGLNRWWSDAGSLTFTLALDPVAHGLRPGHEPMLALATAVAVIEVLGTLNLTAPAGLRWPNDIEVAGRKLGGILPERVETPAGPRLLIGIGLNVATRIDDSPEDVRRMAVSLADLQGTAATPLEPGTLLQTILGVLPAILTRLAADDPGLAARWAELDTLCDQVVRVDLGPHVISGVARGIDDKGALRLITANGLMRLVGGRVLRP